MNQIVQTVGLANFKNEFCDYNLTEYDFIYVSLGSKFNQSHIYYTMPYDKQICKLSNAEFQMIPAFCRHRKTLAICIDRFENATVKQDNIRIVATILGSEPTIEMILCDLDGTIQLFETMVRYIIEKCILVDTEPTRLMIVNYINFISPNHTEYYLEQKLSEAIDKVICKTPFHSCFYQWFGYQPNLYNYVYKYKAQYISYGLPVICDILQKSIGYEDLSVSNNEIVIQKIDDKNRQLYDMFLQNIRDICVSDN